MKIKPQTDKYLRYYGGDYKLFDVYCRHCKGFLFIYQKDGWRGAFKRCYLNRIMSKAYITEDEKGEYHCEHCDRWFGMNMYHKKTARYAIRLFTAEVFRRAYKP